MRDKNKSRPARSLTFTLAVALFSMSAVILLMNGVMGSYTNYRALRDNVSLRLQLDAHKAGEVVEASIQEKINALETSAEFADPTRTTVKDQQVVLENLLGLQAAFRQLALLDVNGNPTGQISRLSSALLPQFQSHFKGDVLIETEQGRSYISPVYIDEVTSEPLALLAVPIQDVFGDFQGILAAEMNLKFMWELIDQMKIGETGYAFVVDNQGKLIAFEDITRVLAGEDITQNFEVKEFLQNLSAESDLTPEIESYSGIVGETVTGFYEPLGTPNWAVVLELPTAEAYQPVSQSLIRSGASILVFAILVGVMGVLMARRLSAPLVDLAKVASEIAGGNLAAEAKRTGPAELVQLASTFNMMTTRLRDLIASLEQRVADRTKALATSAEVSRYISTIMDRQKLVEEVTERVNSAFNYYHTQMYFYDPDGNELLLAGGTGIAGKTLLAQGHKILKGKGLVGRAAETNAPVLVSDVSTDSNWLPNPLLPETKSEAAIPISAGDVVAGVLDVQHDTAGGLTQVDVEILQSIANQIMIATQNGRLLAEAQKRAERETLLTAINQKIQSATTVENALQVAVREVGRALGTQTSIRLKSSNGNGNQG